jgi:asparagine synthase (glutamine-hydrolysing)
VYRYVGLIWDSENASAATTAARFSDRILHSGGWSSVLNERGLILLHADATPRAGSSETRMLAAGAGAVCGRLFRREHELKPRTAAGDLSAEETRSLVASAGRALIERYWGRYVAFVRNAAAGEVHVLRDPTGCLPCFVTTVDGVSLVFSDLESIFGLPGLELSINWRYIAAFVPYSALQIRETGLEGVTEVQPGESLTFRAGSIERRLLWNPLDVAGRGLIEEPTEAIAAIHECVRACVHAWADLHRSVIHNLSGGLDSSIVLSCLMDAPGRPDVTCLHFFAPASREDERKYARLAAGHFNAELIERALDPNALELERLLHIRRTPRPWSYIYDLEQGIPEAQIAASRNATAIFSGAAGDGLFLQARAELAVADYLRRHGFSAGVMRVALHAARITRTSLWPILRNGARYHLNRSADHASGPVEIVRALIPAEVMAAARNDDSLIHPWLAAAGSIPPGLRWHIMTLSVPPMFYGAFDHELEIERSPPLLSQPLVELCLRIPSYVWISGGRDRSLVRDAFAKYLPPAIVRRTRKGAIDRHNRKLMDANEAFLREMLLDGLLVKHGLLDRQKLESFLSRGPTPHGFEYNDVLRQHLCTEVWLRRWSVPTSSDAH